MLTFAISGITDSLNATLLEKESYIHSTNLILLIIEALK